jgi:hypothetical protein
MRKYLQLSILGLFLLPFTGLAQQFHLRPTLKLSTLKATEFQYSKPVWNGQNGFLLDTFDVEGPVVLGVSLGLSIDWHLLKLGKEASLGLHSSPSLGLYLPGTEAYWQHTGVPYFYSVPMHLQCNLGAFSTTQSEAEHGIGLGLGLHYLNMHYNQPSNPANMVFAGPNSWLMPSTRLSYRYWNSKGSLSTINLIYARSSARATGVRTNFRQHFLEISFNIQVNY